MTHPEEKTPENYTPADEAAIPEAPSSPPSIGSSAVEADIPAEPLVYGPHLPEEYPAVQEQVDEAPTAPAAESNRKTVGFTLAGLAVGILVGFCGNYSVTGIQEMVASANATALSAAVEECDLVEKEGVTLKENNKVLTIDTKTADEKSGASQQNAVCLVDAMSVPKEIIQKLNETKLGDSRQDAAWNTNATGGDAPDNRAISWEFSESEGIKMEFTIKS